jgi:putative ABC transport system substrate-binding protein
MPVVGYLNAAMPEGYVDQLRAFRQGLNENGYVEGENVAIEYRWGDNEPDRLIALAADLVRRPVNVIAAASAPASLAAAKATTAIPTVFMVPEDPVRLGLVASLARPGGNATGVNFFAAELAAKRLQLLRTLVPGARRLAVLLNPAEPTIAEANKRDVEVAAKGMGLEFAFSTPALSLKLMLHSWLLRAIGRMLCSSAAAPSSPVGASSWLTSRPATPSPRSVGRAPMPKSAG